MKWLCLVFGMLAGAGPGAGEACAQSARPAGHRPEIDLGAVWTRGGRYGSANANLTTPAGAAQPLFAVSTHLGTVTALDARLAFPVAGRLRAEVAGTWGHATVRSQVSGDFEHAAPVTLSNRLTVFTIEASGIWSFGRHGRLEPFVCAGGGWMRELTEDEALAGDGTVANGGAGVKYWWFERDRGLLRRLGWRAEARAVGRFGGLELGTNDRLVSPAASVSAIIGF